MGPTASMAASVTSWSTAKGLVLRAKVHTADTQDRAAVPLLLEGVAEHFPRIEHRRCGWTRATRGVVRVGSRSISAGGSRWFGTRHNHAVNGCHTAIGKIGGQCGSPGSDCRRRRRCSVAYSPGAGWWSGRSPGSVKVEGSAETTSGCVPPASAYLCRNGPADVTEVGSHLSFQTVFSGGGQHRRAVHES